MNRRRSSKSHEQGVLPGGVGQDNRIRESVGRGTPVTIYLDDRPIPAYTGETVAAALMAAGVKAFRRSPRRGEARGPHCGIGNCFECILIVDGKPNVRTCNLTVRDGMALRTQKSPRRSGPSLNGNQTGELVIAGGGPAGMRAAIEAARAGVKCILIDEASALGGQIYRAIPEEFTPGENLQKSKDFVSGQGLREEFETVADRVEVRADTAVLGVWNTTTDLQVLCARGDDCEVLGASKLIVAAGAYDRPVPFPGWTLPGVMTAGGVQSFTKTMGVRPGRRALVAGTGPLLLVIANQLAEAGVEVVGVLEAGRRPGKLKAATAFLGHGGLIRDARDYFAGLRRHGIPLLYNHVVFRADGSDAVDSVEYGTVNPGDWTPNLDRPIRANVDLLVVGYSFVPNTELTVLAGCEHRHEGSLGGWVPVRDQYMRTTVPGVLAAGDGSGVAGVLVAEEEGRLAGIVAAEELGALTPAEATVRRTAPMKKLWDLDRPRRYLDELSRIRPGLAMLADEETPMCRCEEVLRGDVDEAIDHGARDLQAVKLATRLGMGPCQGRYCGPATALYMSRKLSCPPEACGRINPQPPVRPVTLGGLAECQLGAAVSGADGDDSVRASQHAAMG